MYILITKDNIRKNKLCLQSSYKSYAVGTTQYILIWALRNGPNRQFLNLNSKAVIQGLTINYENSS